MASPGPGVPGTGARMIAPLKPSETSPQASTTQSLTQKTWVIPPRPKPGRKPATDTPATKRKAQNRVAQRAFRERKAAKIEELEEQMDEMIREHQSEVDGLKTELWSLSAKLDQSLSGGVNTYDRDVQHLKMELETWKASYMSERKLREALEKEVAILKGDAVSLPRKPRATPPARHPLGKAHTQHQDAPTYGTPEEMPLGCDLCSLTHCQCLEDALNAPASSQHTVSKRPVSPSVPSRSNDKKPKTDSYDNVVSNDVSRSDDSTTSNTAPDNCGFCSDGTTCLCAELAVDRQRADDQPSSLPSPPGEDDRGHPANPIEIDFTNFDPIAAKLTASPKPQSCANGPGTCEQCRGDPASMGFCKGLAAMKPAILSTASASGETLSCARAFTTLKQHPAFDKATKNIQEWLPQLNTVPAANPRPVPASGPSSYTAFEIEGASVLGVLKFFDRRFGTDS